MARSYVNLAKRGLEDLFWFANAVCGFKDMDDSLHGDICEAISKEILSESGKIAIIIPRDHFKSSIGQAAVLWMFTRKSIIEKNYEWRTLIDSATLNLSRKHLRWIYNQLLHNEHYKRMYGSFLDRKGNYGDREIYSNARSAYNTKKEPNFASSGVMAEVTGLHFDFMWFDDLVTERNYATPMQRQKVIEHYNNLHQLREASGVVLYTATPWHDGDLTGYISRLEREHLSEGKEKEYTFYRRGCFNKDGTTIFPSRWPEKKLLKRKENLPARIWASQWLCDPVVPQESIPFDPVTLYKKRMEFPQELRAKIVTVDPNFREREKTQGDFGCIVVGGFDRWMSWWGLDVQLGRWKAAEFIDRLFDVYETWKPNQLRIERKFTSFLSYAINLQMGLRGISLPIVWIDRDNRSKETRYQCLEPLFAAGRIHFADEIPQSTRAEMEDEMTRVGSSAHDDFLDALADQINGIRPILNDDAKLYSTFGDVEGAYRQDRRTISPMEITPFLMPAEQGLSKYDKNQENEDEAFQ